MNLSSLKFAEGSKKKPKRIGRGQGSGRGGTATKGHKGQRSRAGSKRRAHFEGGQMPIHRRLPKRGFTNIFKEEFQIVNICRLNALDENEVNAEILKANGIINKVEIPVKLLGNGDIDRPIKITVNAASASAKAKIEAAGGEVVVI
ncbi:MAG: 50S ribosomal protein L15 [candidate division Zixibacteria bacterium]|nr:50S ribosomal protein L15 [Candidatus Tariuqbacter arcticus]